jgi:hypothetical protein
MPAFAATAFTHLRSWVRISFLSLLGKVARSAEWGVARCFDPSRIARSSPRTFKHPDLLSAPHPPLPGAFPAHMGRPGSRGFEFNLLRHGFDVANRPLGPVCDVESMAAESLSRAQGSRPREARPRSGLGLDAEHGSGKRAPVDPFEMRLDRDDNAGTEPGAKRALMAPRRAALLSRATGSGRHGEPFQVSRSEVRARFDDLGQARSNSHSAVARGDRRHGSACGGRAREGEANLRCGFSSHAGKRFVHPGSAEADRGLGDCVDSFGFVRRLSFSPSSQAAAVMTAPLMTSPKRTYFHRATRSLRASATIAVFLRALVGRSPTRA